MVDCYDSLTDKDIERAVHRSRLEKAIVRTRKLLSSSVASQNPELAATWSERLARQEDNFMGVCKF
ncbi:hypothetical protein H0X10_03805 [Candidatus Saccharibacteria bacterium]|nr:hypothetical protein [Candidatus Saccharibacteria bacterium]